MVSKMRDSDFCFHPVCLGVERSGYKGEMED